MTTSHARTRRMVQFTVAPVAIILAGLLVWQGSNAAFTATTRSSGNSWSTGQVTLTDDDLGAAAITIQNMVPMQTGTKCIVVTSNSNVAGEVRTYFSNLSPSAQHIEDRIMISGLIGTGGTFNDCTGFVPSGPTDPAAPLSTLATYAFNYASGTSAWITSGTPGEKRTFKFTWTFDTTGLSQQQIDALQGGTISVDAIWELQTA